MNCNNKFNKLFYDDCNIKQKNQDNFSIFNYYTDKAMYTNIDNKLTQNSPGTPPENLISIENDLKGITRDNSKCIYKKYLPKQYI